MGQFDQAIACFIRVEQAKPGDEEAQRAIADLAVERTISHGGYEEAESSHRRQRATAQEDDDKVQLTPEQQLEKKIAKKPADVSLYVELADLHIRNERLAEAEDRAWPRHSKYRGATSACASGWKTSNCAATAIRSS